MHLSIAFYVIVIMGADFLTHQKITQRLKDMPRELRTKQNGWCKDNMNNELVFFKSYKNSNLHELIDTRLRNYLTTFPEVGLYVVSITCTKKPFYIDKYPFAKLLYFASELIKTYKVNGKDISLILHNYIIDCWKVTTDYEFRELFEVAKTAALIYIDGSFPDYDFYSSYLGFYLRCKVIYQQFEPSMVIALQKDKEKKQFFDIDEIVRETEAYKDCDTHYSFGKIRNFAPNSPSEYWGDDKSIFADITAVYADETSKSISKKQLICEDVYGYRALSTKIKYETTTEENLNALNSKITKSYPRLEYNKVIGQDVLILTKDNIIYMQIKFIYFLVKNETIYCNKPHEYEVLVMVALNDHHKDYHVSAYKYPVKDKDGKDTIVELDQNSPYHIKMMRYNQELNFILDALYQNYVNDSDHNYMRVGDFLNIFKTKDRFFYNHGFLNEIFKFNQDIKTYHEKNRTFVKNLKALFGEKVTIRLFDVYRDSNHLYYDDCLGWLPDMTHGAVLNKEISIYEYENYDKDDFNDIFILITISDGSDKTSSYLFLQGKDRSYARHVENKIIVSFSYKRKVEDYLSRIISNVQDDEEFLQKLAGENTNPCHYINFIKKYITMIGPPLLSYIIDDLGGFFSLDIVFRQKATFFAMLELSKMREIGFKCMFFLKEPVYMDVKNQVNPESRYEETPTDNREKKASNVEFMKSQIKYICNFEVFEDFFPTFSNSLAYNALRAIAFALLKHLRSKFFDKFLVNARRYIIDETFVYLQHNDHLQDEITTRKIHKVIAKTFNAVQVKNKTG